MDDDTRAAVAEAILEHGSPRFTVAEGRMLDLLSEIAQRGDLTAFSEACHAYCTAFPKSRRVLEDYAPVKILSAYVCRQPDVDQSKAEQLRAADPQWADRIKDALWTPQGLKAVAEELHDQLRTLSAPASPAAPA
jgi:hypothetical protein